MASTKAFLKTLPSAELAEEKQRFLDLFAQPRVVEALRRFVESDDKMPYLPSGET